MPTHLTNSTLILSGTRLVVGAQSVNGVGAAYVYGKEDDVVMVAVTVAAMVAVTVPAIATSNSSDNIS